MNSQFQHPINPLNLQANTVNNNSLPNNHQQYNQHVLYQQYSNQITHNQGNTMPNDSKTLVTSTTSLSNIGDFNQLDQASMLSQQHVQQMVDGFKHLLTLVLQQTLIEVSTPVTAPTPSNTTNKGQHDNNNNPPIITTTILQTCFPAPFNTTDYLDKIVMLLPQYFDTILNNIGNRYMREIESKFDLTERLNFIHYLVTKFYQEESVTTTRDIVLGSSNTTNGSTSSLLNDSTKHKIQEDITICLQQTMIEKQEKHIAFLESLLKQQKDENFVLEQQLKQYYHSSDKFLTLLDNIMTQVETFAPKMRQMVDANNSIP